MHERYEICDHVLGTVARFLLSAAGFTTNLAGAQFFLPRHKLGRALKKEGTAYAARPQKTLFPRPASGAFAQGAFGAVHSGGAVAGVQLHDAAAAFFCPGHHDFCRSIETPHFPGTTGM